MTHPDGNCDDCGVTHTPWSIVQSDTARGMATLGEATLLLDRLLQVIEELDPPAHVAHDVLTHLSDRYVA